MAQTKAKAREGRASPAEWPKGTVFTVGHSTLPIEQFLAVLRAYGVKALADVRTVPKSRHNPQFNSDSLRDALAEVGIAYIPMPALGGLRRAQKESLNTGWRNASFRGYADYMQTAPFQAALEELIALGRKTPSAIMCAEAVPWRCHRSLIADALNVHGIPVIEILSEHNARAHKLTPFARVEGERITYPPEQPTLL